MRLIISLLKKKNFFFFYLFKKKLINQKLNYQKIDLSLISNKRNLDQPVRL